MKNNKAADEESREQEDMHDKESNYDYLFNDGNYFTVISNWLLLTIGINYYFIKFRIKIYRYYLL